MFHIKTEIEQKNLQAKFNASYSYAENQIVCQVSMNNCIELVF